MGDLKSPFPYFGGKRTVVNDVWSRLGRPKQYLEPFCGSAAMLLASPTPASLEVVGDANGYIANFWRAVKHQPGDVALAADYPVSHIDLGARHQWLLDRREEISQALHDPEWPGDAKAAGWWLWGQCAWIGSGWCEKPGHVGNAGMGIQAVGQIPHISDAGRGIQAVGQIPHVGNAGRGELLTTAGRVAWEWLHRLSTRLDRVRLIHGDWSRCLNHHYGGINTAVFLDPPYLEYESLYQSKQPVALQVAEWARAHEHLRIAICGHLGDYDLPGWDAVQWSRSTKTYGSAKTKNSECIWYSPACISAKSSSQKELDL